MVAESCRVPPTDIFTEAGDIATVATAPAIAVAVKPSGVSAPMDALSVFAPTNVPSVHAPGVATPTALVTAVATPTFPPPPVTVKRTVAPGIGFASASVTNTVGVAGTSLPTTAVCDSADSRVNPT